MIDLPHRCTVYRMVSTNGNPPVNTAVLTGVPCLYSPESRETRDPYARVAGWTEGTLYVGPDTSISESDVVMLTRPASLRLRVIAIGNVVMGFDGASHREYATRQGV